MLKFIKLGVYWLPRLPWRFTVTFAVLLLFWLGVVAAALNFLGLPAISAFVVKLVGLPNLAAANSTGLFGFFVVALNVFLEGGVAVLLLLLTVLLSYNLSAIVYRKVRKTPVLKVQAPAAPTPGSDTSVEKFVQQRNIGDLKIGIILAGGGAKGAYQAGAMKAIYEFLEENGALDKVRMIAGTSIGSWNAMFWLAGLVKAPGPNQMSSHEQWWREIRINKIVEFANYIPFAKNYFLYNTPWQETFEDIFVKNSAIKETLNQLFVDSQNPDDGAAPMHFYFTRSNVEQGHIEFATNNKTLPEKKRIKWGTADTRIEEPVVPHDRYEIVADNARENPFEQLRQAVFASMDLPPLFPYIRIRTDRYEWFEDGGVVDNLPLRFGTELEGCNLLFVLPLNASFAEPANHNSVLKRLYRVMDIRQGVLERNSIKLARLYNDRAMLLNAASARNPEASKSIYKPRFNDFVSVFAICPKQPLSIGTSEFWKTEEAGEAFDLMYAVTKSELQDKFLEATDPNRLRMALVGPNGEKTYFEDF
ncbi:MAG: patatin-like phospholipase family protein [bacterium]